MTGSRPSDAGAVEFVDTTTRDGNQSLWSATGLTTPDVLSIAPSELRPEGSKVHELMEISFARIRAALNGDTLPPSPNPPGRYPNVAAYPPGDLRGVEDATVDSCDPAGEGGAK